MMLRADENTSDLIFRKLEKLEKICIPDGWPLESFKSESLKNNGIVLYIQEDNGEISGLLTAYTAIGEADITNVAVSPEYRLRGYAINLISELEKIIPEDTENIFLEVRESNISAINLYLKSGFEKISVRKRFYSHPLENAVIMKKKVSK